jgi:hypothetical protein
MIRENERIGQYDILPSTRSEYHDLSNVIGSQGLHAFVHCVGLGLVTAEADD